MQVKWPALSKINGPADQWYAQVRLWLRCEDTMPDGNFYARDSKLRPAGAADDLLAKTGNGPPISPVTPCNAPATDPIQSIEPRKLR